MVKIHLNRGNYNLKVFVSVGKQLTWGSVFAKNSNLKLGS